MLKTDTNLTEPKIAQSTKFFISFIFLLITGVLLLHSFILLNNLNAQAAMIHKVANNQRHYSLLLSIINASQVLPSTQLDVLRDLSHYQLKLNNYRVDFSISDQPKWPLHLQGKVTANAIHQLIKRENNQVKLSYLMPNGQWLNYSEILRIDTYKLTIILFLIELLFIALLLFYGWSIYRLKLPLEKLKSSAQRLGIDFKAAPLEETGPLLVQETSRAMNLMQARIQELITNRTQLLAAISHDLRTPITRLQLRAQLLDNDELANKITQDLDEMKNMISGVLSFARQDSFNEEKTKFDFVSLVLTICDDFIDLGHSIKVDINISNCDINGRRLALKRCLGNVIHNATKYGTHLQVKLMQEGEFVCISVEDNGPGIPSDELTQVYKPFYRSESSRQKFSTGAGLGLTVAYEVVKDHQGEIKLENLEPHGLRVVIKLPLFMFPLQALKNHET